MAELSFWGWVALLIRLAPDIISLVKSSIVWVDGKIDLARTRAALGVYIEAATKAQKTGDTSDVENIFNPPR